LPTELGGREARLKEAFKVIGFLFEAKTASTLRRRYRNIRSVVHANILPALNTSGRMGFIGGLLC
jgi:hypothetical protein